MDKLRKGLVEIKMEGRFKQSELESSIALINDLIRQREDLTGTRMPANTPIMKQGDRQPDERLKLMSESMHRRDTDVDKRMVDLLTTTRDLTDGT